MAIQKETLGSVLTTSNPNQIADALKGVNLGVMLAAVSETLSNPAPATTIVLNKPSFGPGSMHVRVTVGVSVGKYVVSDAAGVAVDVGAEIGVCKLNAAGTELEFASAVEEVIVSYLAASETSLDTTWPGSGAGSI